MPVIITYELQGASTLKRNRVQCFFERFGWENLGGSSYRYPRLGSDQPTEDWFNHVIPALMLFRASVVADGMTLTKFTLDVQTSTGYSPDTGYGTLPVDTASPDFHLYAPSHPGHFGEQNLKDWIDGIAYPY